MASTKEIRRRIKSIKNTSQITKAMQLVAAAKMRRAQDSALGGKTYSLLMGDLLLNLSRVTKTEAHPLLAVREGDKKGILLITPNRGLVGALNTNLVREAEALTYQAAFVTIGKKGRDYVVKTRQNLVSDFELSDKVDFDIAKTLSRTLRDSFIKGDYAEISLLYTDFINTLTQKPKLVQLLPLKREELATQIDISAPNDYLIEPNPSLFLDALLPHFVDMKIFQALLEAQASEHSARMVAMKNATDNALELVGDLNLTYNRIRQEKITNEILEITAAAVAME